MPGRKYEATTSYRYGFNGKEKDKEMNSLTEYDYGFRIYNPAIAKFLSIDPLFKEFPWNSPYAFAENDVIRAIDLEGLERKVVTYGQKIVSKEMDDGYVKTCANAGAKAMGLTPQPIYTGKGLLNLLKAESKDIGQTISVYVNYGHSWCGALFLQNDNGFYRKDETPGKTAGPDYANFMDLLRLSSKGEIRFSQSTLMIFASCGTMGTCDKTDNAKTFNSNGFAVLIGNYINKNYSLPDADYVGYYKVTTIGATDLSNLKTDGTVKTDGTFIKYEVLYKIERKVIIEKTKKGWWIFSKTVTNKTYQDKTTIVDTKQTDLGNKIDPAKLSKEHNDKDATISH